MLLDVRADRAIIGIRCGDRRRPGRSLSWILRARTKTYVGGRRAARRRTHKLYSDRGSHLGPLARLPVCRSTSVCGNAPALVAGIAGLWNERGGAGDLGAPVETRVAPRD